MPGKSSVAKKGVSTKASKNKKDDLKRKQTDSKLGKQAKGSKGKTRAAATGSKALGAKKSKASKSSVKGKKEIKKAGDGKAAANKKKGKKTGKKIKSDDDDTSIDEDDTANDEKTEENLSEKLEFGREILLPKLSEFDTPILPIKVFPIKSVSYKQDIEDMFVKLEKLLAKRKQACLAVAEKSVAELELSQNEDTNKNDVLYSLYIDTEYIEDVLNHIGTDFSDNIYNLRTVKTQCIDKLRGIRVYSNEMTKLSKELGILSGESPNIKNEMVSISVELSQLSPHLTRARDAIKEIKKSSLDEIRALKMPHQLLVKTVKACAIMVGFDDKGDELDGWSNIRKLLKSAFINNLINFEARSIDTNVKELLLSTEYLGVSVDSDVVSDKMTVENGTKVNKVCGNLIEWLISQLKYNDFIPKVEPMQLKMSELAKNLDKNDINSKALLNGIKELEKRINETREELDNEMIPALVLLTNKVNAQMKVHLLSDLTEEIRAVSSGGGGGSKSGRSSSSSDGDDKKEDVTTTSNDATAVTVCKSDTDDAKEDISGDATVITNVTDTDPVPVISSGDGGDNNANKSEDNVELAIATVSTSENSDKKDENSPDTDTSACVEVVPDTDVDNGDNNTGDTSVPAPTATVAEVDNDSTDDTNNDTNVSEKTDEDNKE